MMKKPLFIILSMMFLLFFSISVTGLFGRVVDYNSYHNVCYYDNNVTYNFIINHSGSDSWPCGSLEINDDRIRIECISQFDGGNAGYQSCSGGMSCVRFSFDANKSTGVNTNSEEPSWDPVGSLVKTVTQTGYTYSEYKTSSFTREIVPNIFYSNNNSCPAAIIQSADPTNDSIYRKQLITVNLTTDTQSICRYSNVSGIHFSNMTLFNNTNATLHNFSINLEDNAIYNYYFKCNDTIGDVNPSDYYLTFFSEYSIPVIELNDSSLSNITTNTTLFLFANFSDSGNGFAAYNSCEFCLSGIEFCEKATTEYSIDYLSGNCSYSWNTSTYDDYDYTISLKINDTVNNTGTWSKYLFLDRTGPEIISVRPFDDTVYNFNTANSTFSVNIYFEYYIYELAYYNFDSNSNCSIILNDKLTNVTQIEISASQTHDGKPYLRQGSSELTIGTTENSQYNWSISCEDPFGNIGTFPTRKFFLVDVGNFSGDTTDLSTTNISNIENLTFEEVTSGKIMFSESINLSGVLDINKYVKIYNNRIEINSSFIPSLNKSATLYLYNLTYDNPRIMRDDLVCPSTICKKVNYSDGTLIFNVTQFSAYSTEETPDEPTPPSDDGSSGGGSGGGGGGSSGGGGGGGGGGAFYTCNMDWECDEWSDCIKDVQIRDCNFIKVAQHTQSTPCPEESNVSETRKSCEIPKETLVPEPEPINETKSEELSLKSETETKPKESGGLGAITGAIIGNLFATSGRSLKLDMIVVSLIVIVAISFFTYRKFKPDS